MKPETQEFFYALELYTHQFTVILLVLVLVNQLQLITNCQNNRRNSKFLHPSSFGNIMLFYLTSFSGKKINQNISRKRCCHPSVDLFLC